MRFLLNDVEIEFSDSLPDVDPVEYQNVNIQANDCQFRMVVPGIAEFYAEDGKNIKILDLGGSKDSIELYLNGSVLGAILDQRKILVLHGSSFKLMNNVVIVSGESGFGKSSIIYNLVKNKNAEFITDDITPINNGMIIPISDSVKLWKDALNQMNVDLKQGKQLEDRSEKYLLDLTSIVDPVAPNVLLFGDFSDSDSFEIEELEGGEKLAKTLVNQYWKNLTTAVKESRMEIFSEITALCNDVKMFDFKRPKEASIKETSDFLLLFLTENLS